MRLTPREDLVTMPQNDRDFTHTIRSAVSTPLKSGIAVFSSTGKALYVNATAKALVMRLHQKENGHSANSAMPRSVDHLLEEMLSIFRTIGQHHGWTELTPKALLAVPDQPIWVKAFGIRGEGDEQRSLIIITMQEVPPAF